MPRIKILICALLFIIIALSVSIVSGRQAAKEERQSNIQKIRTVYANIIYAFASNKEKDLLRSATHVIRNEILYINKSDNIETKRYDYLCPMLNNSFKNLILDYINEEEDGFFDKKIVMTNPQDERKSFNRGYKKLLNSCDTMEE